MLAALTALSAAVAVSPALAEQQKNLILATTTSTQDSGLLDVLIPIFEKETGYFVKTISVGSGQAMKMGERGEADVLLVHSPEAEKTFMAKGFGVNRKLVMHNDFLILGPATTPPRSAARRPPPRPSKRSPRPARCSCPGATTPGPTPRRRGSGRRQGSTPRGRNGSSRPAWAWARP